MFNILPNLKTRDIINSFSLEELVKHIKNPCNIVKSSVDVARLSKKGSESYNRIKMSLPCFIPNYTHDSYVKASTVLNSTGYLYIDLDEQVDIDFSNFPFVAAAWESMSGKGKSILVAVGNMPKAGCSKVEIQFVVEQVSETLGIKCDLAAISRDRVVVLGYDYNPYYNANHSLFTITYKESKEKVINDELKKKDKTRGIRLEVNDNFYSDTLRIDNFDEIRAAFHFESEEVFKDLKSNKINYTEIYIPSKISNGIRNSKLYNIVSNIYGLNPNADKNRIYSFMLKVNSSRCVEPLEPSEILDMCTKVLSKEPTLYSNKQKTYLFNDDYSLTGKEKTSIAVTENNKRRALEKTEIMLEYINKWDVEKMGKITYVKLAFNLGIGKATVARRAKDIKEVIKNINNSLVVSK